MTERPDHGRQLQPRPVIEAFPRPGRGIEHAYRELHVALHGEDEQKAALGDPAQLARPWDPPSCIDPELRAEIWDWLERVVAWMNREYTWDTAAMVPPCWPRHPHLVHEVAVIADLRWRAGRALTGEPLEEWHRYALPAFVDRMRQRLKSHCEDNEHQPWPAQGRHARHIAQPAADERSRIFELDLHTLDRDPLSGAPSSSRLRLVDGYRVDVDTGEVLD